MSDHKRVGLHRAFSPSGLSAAPGSNIHLAWCIPGLETLMWFVGESRWQVHGSTLLTDSAGASGRVHNNTECLNPPSFPLFSNHILTTRPSTCMHTHAFSLLISMCWCREIAEGNRSGCWHSAQHYQSCDLLFSTLLSVFLSLLFCLSLSLSTSYCLCIHLFCLTSLHSLLLLPHSCTCPLTRPPIILWLPFTPSITLLILLSSPFLLSSTFSQQAHTQVLEIWCLVLPLQCRNDVMQ